MPEYLSFSPDMTLKESLLPSSREQTFPEEIPQPEARAESLEEIEQDGFHSQRVVRGIETLLTRASSGASLRTASLLRIGGVLIALAAGIVGSLRDARAEEIHYPEVGGIHLPQGEIIPIYPDQRLESAQKFLEEARKELTSLQRQETSLRASQKNSDVAYEMGRRLRVNLSRQQNLISRMAEREALVDQLSQTLENQDAERVGGLLEQSQGLREKGKIKKAEKLEEQASVRLYGTANGEMDVYMASIGIREAGRRIAIPDEAGNIQVFTIDPGLQVNGFYQDKHEDTFTIVLKTPANNYYGFFLKEGKLYAHGACTESGRSLTH